MTRTAVAEDLPEILRIVALSKQVMLANGNDQWNSDYPGEKDYAGDIEKRQLFVETDENDTVRGVMCLNDDFPEAYEGLRWKTSSPSMCIHRIAVDTACRNAGVARSLFAFAEQYARQKGIRSIRLDTFSRNIPAQRLFVGMGYEYVGEIYMKGRSIPYRCYEKSVDGDGMLDMDEV